jgi:LDH2 family malate/lactate/ureidoglycolate dehydrogenase
MADIRIDSSSLEQFVAAVWEKAGFTAQDAATEAHVLVWANLRGVDSHGVLRVPSYLASIRRGGMNPRAQIRIERETPAIALIEGDNAFGPVVTTYAMEVAIAKARQVGIGWVVIRNTTHQGCMAYYPMMAVAQNMAGMAIVCNPPNMAPLGPKRRRGAQQPAGDRGAGRRTRTTGPGHGHQHGGLWQGQPRAG